MKLNKMFRNVLDYTLDALQIKVEEDSAVRKARLEAATTKFVTPATSKAKPNRVTLSDQEKAILKSLGLNLKNVQALIKTEE